MPAESAVATDEIVAGQENGERESRNVNRESGEPASADVAQNKTPIHSEPIGDRLKSILGNMDLPADVLETTLGGDDLSGKQESRNAEDDPDEEEQTEEDSSGKQESGKEEGPEELTDEQKNQWAPEALARIHKKTAQLTAERTKREAVERENAELKSRAQGPPPTLQPTAANPLANVHTVEELGQTKATLERWLSWSRRHPNGATDVVVGKDAKGEDVIQDFTPEEVAALEDDIDLTLRNAVPAQAEFIRERAKHDAIAQADFPEIYSGEETEERVMAREILRAMPELLRLPDAAVQVGIFVRARKAYDAEKAGKNGATTQKVVSKNPSVAAFTRPQPPRAPALPRVQRPSTETVRPDQDVKAAEERAVASAGSPESMQELVTSLRRAQGKQRNGQRLTAA